MKSGIPNFCAVALALNDFGCVRISYQYPIVWLDFVLLQDHMEFEMQLMFIVLRRYKALGIRLDSGDLAYLSREARNFFCTVERELKVPGFGKMVVTASNDLNEETIDALNKQVTP